MGPLWTVASVLVVLLSFLRTAAGKCLQNLNLNRKLTSSCYLYRSYSLCYLPMISARIAFWSLPTYLGELICMPSAPSCCRSISESFLAVPTRGSDCLRLSCCCLIFLRKSSVRLVTDVILLVFFVVSACLTPS